MIKVSKERSLSCCTQDNTLECFHSFINKQAFHKSGKRLFWHIVIIEKLCTFPVCSFCKYTPVTVIALCDSTGSSVKSKQAS